MQHLRGRGGAPAAAVDARRISARLARLVVVGTDAPRTTKAMHVAIDDLGVEHLWVVYPGSLRYSLTDRITALPLVDVNEIAFQPLP